MGKKSLFQIDRMDQERIWCSLVRALSELLNNDMTRYSHRVDKICRPLLKDILDTLADKPGWSSLVYRGPMTVRATLPDVKLS